MQNGLGRVFAKKDDPMPLNHEMLRLFRGLAGRIAMERDQMCELVAGINRLLDAVETQLARTEEHRYQLVPANSAMTRKGLGYPQATRRSSG